jgi:glycosyltransferase involved in cell wall biosynthesis
MLERQARDTNKKVSKDHDICSPSSLETGFMNLQEESIIKVLTIGQTPPPFHGQSVSINRIIHGRYKRLKIFHVRLFFSRNIDEIGRFSFYKIYHLVTVILSIIYMRFRYNIHILHYPPAGGGNPAAIYRDMIILIATRRLFRQTIFFFHAGGISEAYQKLPRWLKYLFRLAYFSPDLAIALSSLNPPDSELLEAKKNIILGYGIEDVYPLFQKEKNEREKIPILLYTGIINESKGIMLLLEACRILRSSGRKFKLEIMGDFASSGFRNTAMSFIKVNSLEDQVNFNGVLVNDEKWKKYAAADIFCFPSFYENETFGLVIIEAMQFELPVISTHWRGIPSIVKDGHSGFLVPVKDSIALAEKITLLIDNPELRALMGRCGRQIYLDNFTAERFWNDLEEAFLSIK